MAQQDTFDHLAALGSIPEAPGVYMMKDKTGKIVYIGKSINLKSRVRSYFSGSDPRPFVKRLGKILGDIETLITHNEKEALILENNLIKAHKPRYNVLLKDDKSYLSLVLDTRAQWPRLVLARRGQSRKPGVKVFGPYHAARAARQTLALINRHFMLRTCPDHVLKNRSRPCLEYQIKRCPAPCVFDVDPQSYARDVEEVALFLEGRTEELKAALVQRMEEASEALDFEVAARLRDQIKAITKAVEASQVVETAQTLDQDVLGLYREGDRLTLQWLFVRRGKLESTQVFHFKDHELPDEELLSSFLNQYYHSGALIPHEVLLPMTLPDADALQEVLGDIRGSKVKLRHPRRGAGVKLMEAAAQNAAQSFRKSQDRQEQSQDLLAKLQKRLRLQNFPARMECYDISNFQGDKVVGSMVVFEEAEPAKAEYRQFKIKTVDGQDDFASMYEVLERRFKRSLEDDWPFPDLIIIDGGKGQLGQAVALLADLGIHDVDVISLAKSRVASNMTGDSIERSLERVFLPGRKNPVILRQNSAELYLLQRIRDEAHRTAVGFHRKQRRKATLKSGLDEIPGVGPKRRRALLEHFGAVQAVRDADVEALLAVPGLGQAAARKVFAFFNSEQALEQP
jgi:excinuclease ABC subunit C